MTRGYFGAQMVIYGLLVVVGVVGLAVGYWLERRAKKRAHITVTLTLDVSAFNEAMRKLKADFETMGRTIGERVLPVVRDFGRALARMFEQPESALLRAQSRHGARNRTGDGLWQSDACGGWLHDSCPLPGSCDCTCHGGVLR